MNLRNRLNRVLYERGLAEGEVALIARLDQGHLNRIKNGRVKPSLVTALRIAGALGVPVQQLFYLEPPTPGSPTPAPRPARGPGRGRDAGTDQAAAGTAAPGDGGNRAFRVVSTVAGRARNGAR